MHWWPLSLLSSTFGPSFVCCTWLQCAPWHHQFHLYSITLSTVAMPPSLHLSPPALSTLRAYQSHTFFSCNLMPHMNLIPIPEDVEVTALTLKLQHQKPLQGRWGCNILVAVDHGHHSRRAFQWALTNLVHMSDTLHVMHAFPTHLHHGRSEELWAVLQATEVLFDKLKKEAYEVARIKTERQIMEGEPGKVICRESAWLEPAAVVTGCRDRGVLKSVLLGSE